MKTYVYKGERTYVEYFTIEVDAETREEADELVEGGDYEESGHYQDFVGDSDEIEFSHEVGDDDEGDEDDDDEDGGEGGED
jgi:hypothetical protein